MQRLQYPIIAIRISLLTMLIMCFIGCGKDALPVIDDSPYIFPKTIKVYNETINNRPIVTIGSQDKDFAISFHRELENEVYTFEVVQGEFPIVMKDGKGGIWDVFGNNTVNNTSLEPILSATGFWFGWAAMYPGISIYGLEDEDVDFSEKWSEEWDLSRDYVFRGANFDAIQGLESPPTVIYNVKQDINHGFYISDEDRVVAVQVNGVTRIYPHSILNWHEIVNDTLGGEKISVVFSPFTNTATAWLRDIGPVENHFGISGLVYNNNILAFDRNSNSHWSQLRGNCVNGYYKGQSLIHFPILDTKWKTIKEIFQEPEVISNETSFDIDYRLHPLGDYLTNPDYIPFPLFYADERLPKKQRVHGVAVENKAKVYRLADF